MNEWTQKLLIRARRGRLPCPDCNFAGPHEDNGHEGEHLVFLCTNCGMHFDAPLDEEES